MKHYKLKTGKGELNSTSGNHLCGLGQEVIERKTIAPQKINAKRWRLKTVLQNIIYCAVRLIRHAGGIELHFGKRCPWFDVIRDIASSYA
ncbi:MAG: hypothetical protein V3V05_10620 [Pontiella sp.]